MLLGKSKAVAADARHNRLVLVTASLSVDQIQSLRPRQPH